MLIYLLKRLLMTILGPAARDGLPVAAGPHRPGRRRPRTLLGTRATPDLIAKSALRWTWTSRCPCRWAASSGTCCTAASARTSSPASRSTLVGQRLPHTLILAWTSLGLAVLLGIPLGVYSATHPDSWVDRHHGHHSPSRSSPFPPTSAGLFLLLLFAVQLRVHAGHGRRRDRQRRRLHPAPDPAGRRAGRHLGRLPGPPGSRQPAGSAERDLHPGRRGGRHSRKRLVLYKYALKNALIPTVAVLGVGIGNLMGGAVFVEIIFSRPGWAR